MKKSVYLLLIVLLLGIFSRIIVISADLESDLQGQVEDLEQKKETIEEYGEKAKWDYLSQEWKKILLKNEIVIFFDTLFTKISFVFKILFGMDYSLSLVLLGVIFLWLVVFLDVGNVVKSSGFLNEILAYPLSAILAILLAQLHIFEIILTIFGEFFSFITSPWFGVVIFLIFLIIVFILHKFMNIISKNLEAKREEIAKHRITRSRVIINSIGQSLIRSFGKK